MVDGGRIEAGGSANPGPQEALGDVVARSYMIIDITGIAPDAIDGLRQDLADRGAVAVVIPERWTRLVGRFAATGESEHHGVLAVQDELWVSIDPARGKSAHATATRIWNALSGAHAWAVKLSERADPPPPYDEQEIVERELLRRLFVRLPHEEEMRLDVEVLREILAPEPDGGSIALDIRNINTVSVNVLSGFVNSRLGLTGENALPLR